MMVGHNIKKYRKKLKLTQGDLGAQVGVSGVAIMRYEKNQRQPSLEILQKLAEVFDISINEIISDDDQKDFEDNNQEKSIWSSALNTDDHGDMQSISVSFVLPDSEKLKSENPDSFEIKLSVKGNDFEKSFILICDYSYEFNNQNAIERIKVKIGNSPQNEIKYNRYLRNNFNSAVQNKVMKKIIEAIGEYFSPLNLREYDLETTYTI